MKDKKFLIAGIIFMVVATAFSLVYMWSLGIFSGSPSAPERNPVVEEAVSRHLAEKLEEVFKDHETLNIVDAKASAVIYASEFPVDKYTDDTEISEEELDKAIYNNGGSITIELSFEGEALEFDKYKAVVFRIVDNIRTKMEWAPLNMQVFYYRYPSGEETENVMQYESQVPLYLFDRDEKTVITASGVHYIVEVDEELATKTKIYYIVKDVYLVVLSVTIIALLVLFIVKSVKKKKQQKK